MRQNSRKRKIIADSNITKDTKDFLKKEKQMKSENSGQMDPVSEMDKYFLVKHPQELLEFWDWAVKMDSSKAPTETFSGMKSLKLVGPFTLLDDLNKNAPLDSDYLVQHRFSTDLPEMETIMIYRGGRFCYWRDAPKEEPEYLIHVNNEPKHFPEFTIIGRKDPFACIAFLLHNNQDIGKGMRHLLPKSFDLDNYGAKALQKWKSERNRNSLGKPFHGMGIKVEVNEKDVGYRPVTEDTKRLKKEIEQMGTTNSEAEKKVLKDALFKIYSYVQFANDEMDFGMGLEFGHDLFVSNYECFDGMAKSVLSTAYGLLGRNEFATILDRHWQHGRRVNDNKLIN